MTAGSDSRHFALVSDAMFRFSPFRVKGEDLARLHGNNERMAIANLRRDSIGFYHQLLRNTQCAAPAQ
jgi:carboxypeptidase PM20D1